jgi:hypothetical protein
MPFKGACVLACARTISCASFPGLVRAPVVLSVCALTAGTPALPRGLAHARYGHRVECSRVRGRGRLLGPRGCRPDPPPTGTRRCHSARLDDAALRPSLFASTPTRAATATGWRRCVGSPHSVCPVRQLAVYRALCESVTAAADGGGRVGLRARCWLPQGPGGLCGRQVQPQLCAWPCAARVPHRCTVIPHARGSWSTAAGHQGVLRSARCKQVPADHAVHRFAQARGVPPHWRAY